MNYEICGKNVYFVLNWSAQTIENVIADSWLVHVDIVLEPHHDWINVAYD